MAKVLRRSSRLAGKPSPDYREKDESDIVGWHANSAKAFKDEYDYGHRFVEIHTDPIASKMIAGCHEGGHTIITYLVFIFNVIENMPIIKIGHTQKSFYRRMVDLNSTHSAFSTVYPIMLIEGKRVIDLETAFKKKFKDKFFDDYITKNFKKDTECMPASNEMIRSAKRFIKKCVRGDNELEMWESATFCLESEKEFCKRVAMEAKEPDSGKSKPESESEESEWESGSESEWEDSSDDE